MYADDGTNEPGSAIPAGLSHPALAHFGEPGSADPATLRHTCRCGARWSGSRTAHCGGTCHRTFTGVSTFDAHRVGGRCVEPGASGLVLVPGRAYEVWGTYTDPSDDTLLDTVDASG